MVALAKQSERTGRPRATNGSKNATAKGMAMNRGISNSLPFLYLKHLAYPLSLVISPTSKVP